MTLTAPRMPSGRTTALRLVGRAEVDGDDITRPVVPAEDLMQAFAYWHLVPAQELLATVVGEGGSNFALRKTDAIARIPAGGETQIELHCQGVSIADTGFELVEPPKGVSLGQPVAVKDGVKLTLKAACGDDAEKLGYADNLIIEAYQVERPKPQPGAPAIQKRGRTICTLPAIPFEIVPAVK
jgi:hypothetical protein